MVRQNDGELAWDPLWAFVLGEEDEKRRWIKKRNDPKKSDEGFLSYIQDVFPVAESRDEKKVFGSRNEERGKGDTRTKRLWRRGSKAESESAESWQWQFDPSIAGTNSYDTLSSLYSSPNDRRNKSQSSRCKKEQAATSKFWRFSQDPEPGGSWDWNLGSSASSSKKGVRRVRFARSAKSESEEPNLLKGTKVVVEQLQKSQSFIFDLVGINPSTSPLDSCSEGVESSENVSKDFIPLAIPRNKSHAQTKVVSTEKKPEKKEQTSTTESSAFLFADLFNHWGDDSSSLDDLSLTSSQLESSTLDSSVASTEEASDFTEEDDTRSTFTNQSDSSSSFFAREQDKPVLSSRNFSDINLASQPIRQENNSANLLPIIKEEGSNDEPHFYPDDRSESESEPATTLLRELGTTGYTDRLQRLGSVNSILEEFESGKSKSDNGLARHECIDDDSLQQTGLLGRGMCRSVKTLSCEQQTWTAKSGIPFHELSQQELSQIFPKVRSVADEQKYVSSSLLVSPFASGRSGLAHLQANLEQSGPQSLYEYDYESGVHMFVSYDRFGVDELKVITASTPSFIRSESKTSSNEILVQVEASTVSQTDCYVRQGNWWGQTDAPLPNTPGVDFVGRLCRADSEAAKRFGLKVGDRVISLVKWGGNSRYLSVDLSQVVKVPESVDPAAAVCLAETYLAAFQILHRGHNNRVRYRESALKGKTIMILGYGISSMTRAIAQLASHAGALKIFAMAKLKHFEQLSDLGISSVNKDSLEWWDALSGKVDIMVSNEEVVALHHKLLKGNGQIVVVKHGKNDGSSDTYDQKTGIIGRRKKWLHQNRTWSYDVYDEWDHNVERCMLDLHHLLQLLEHKRIEPHVLDRISLGKVARAQQLLESKCLTGFVVCEPWLVAKSRAVRL